MTKSSSENRPDIHLLCAHSSGPWQQSSSRIFYGGVNIFSSLSQAGKEVPTDRGDPPYCINVMPFVVACQGSLLQHSTAECTLQHTRWTAGQPRWIMHEFPSARKHPELRVPLNASPNTLQFRACLVSVACDGQSCETNVLLVLYIIYLCFAPSSRPQLYKQTIGRVSTGLSTFASSSTFDINAIREAQRITNLSCSKPCTLLSNLPS